MSLPRGVADYLFSRSAMLADIEAQVLRVAELWGFQRLMPPALEFEDVISAGMGEGLQARTFRFDDWQSGRLLAIPPDITPQIARIAATRLRGWPMPHRISYTGRVLRHSELQSGRSREIFQSGVELIGLESPEADAEMVVMAVEVLQRLGIAGFKVDLGQVAFCRGIFDSSGLVGDALSRLKEAVSRKDSSDVKDILDLFPVTDASRSEILALPRLFGGVEVLDIAVKVVHNRCSLAALENLKEVVGILCMHGLEEYLTIDLGETRGLDYHTGLTFEGFVPGIGEALFAGGRYDELTARYGFPAPATGFTCNLLNLLQAVENSDSRKAEPTRDILLFNQREGRNEALAIARNLRGQGFSVARDIIRRDIEHSIDYALQAGIALILLLGKDKDDYRIIRVKDRKDIRVTKEQLSQEGFLRRHDLFQERI